jgi:hypothetical protein
MNMRQAQSASVSSWSAHCHLLRFHYLVLHHHSSKEESFNAILLLLYKHRTLQKRRPLTASSSQAPFFLYEMLPLSTCSPHPPIVRNSAVWYRRTSRSRSEELKQQRMDVEAIALLVGEWVLLSSRSKPHNCTSATCISKTSWVHLFVKVAAVNISKMW